MTMTYRQQRVTSTILFPRNHCMRLLSILFAVIFSLSFLLPFTSTALAAAQQQQQHHHDVTDDASPPHGHKYNHDDEEEGADGFPMGNIPLYLSYDVRYGELECLYERITTPHSYLTSSVYVLGTKDGFHGMSAVIVMEGPVAPAGFSFGSDSESANPMSSGTQFQHHLDSYVKDGGIQDENVVKSITIVDFEQGEEDFGYDTDEEGGNVVREENNSAEIERNEERRIINEKRRAAELNLEKLRQEAKLDDDFVKLQMDHHAPQRPEHSEETDQENGSRRRLLEGTLNMKLSAGLPYERTLEITIPGWYRLCVGPHPSGEAISVEMELRSGTKVDPRTGHVVSIEDMETHSEIHSLYKDEVSEEQKAAIASSIIKDEDLVTTREQLRILERVYSEIIAKQLEERRTWNWRTIKNQKSYGHLVMGNFIETLAYMAITGWQVYTIRKWFGGGPTLGR